MWQQRQQQYESRQQRTAAEKAAGDSVLGGFVRWAIKSGIRFSGVRPELRSGVDGSGAAERGLFATAQLTKGDTIVAVPSTSAITLSPGEASPSESTIPQAVWASLPWFVQLAVKLCLAKSAGRAARLADYLAALPDVVDLPVLWAPERLAQLHYPYLEDKVLREREQWDAAALQLSGFLSRHGLRREDLLWALCCVRSRSFAVQHFLTPFALKRNVALLLQALAISQLILHTGLGPAAEAAAVVLPLGWFAAEARLSATAVRYAICPFIDMLNHSGDVEATCSYDVFTDAYKVASCRRYASGEQVLINYGDQSNDQLLQLYGFLEQDNRHDRYVIIDLAGRLKALGPQHAQVAQAAAAAAAGGSGVAGRGGESTSLTTDGEVVITARGFDAALVQSLVSAMGKLASTSTTATSSSSSSSNSPPALVSAPASHTIVVQVALRAALSAELERLPSSLTDDELEMSELQGRLARCRAPPPPPPPAPPPPAISPAVADGVEDSADETSSATATAERSGTSGADLVGRADVAAAASDEADVELLQDQEAFDEVAAEQRMLVLQFRCAKKRLLLDCITSLGR